MAMIISGPADSLLAWIASTLSHCSCTRKCKGVAMIRAASAFMRTPHASLTLVNSWWRGGGDAPLARKRAAHESFSVCMFCTRWLCLLHTKERASGRLSSACHGGRPPPRYPTSSRRGKSSRKKKKKRIDDRLVAAGNLHSVSPRCGTSPVLATSISWSARAAGFCWLSRPGASCRERSMDAKDAADGYCSSRRA